MYQTVLRMPGGFGGLADRPVLTSQVAHVWAIFEPAHAWRCTDRRIARRARAGCGPRMGHDWISGFPKLRGDPIVAGELARPAATQAGTVGRDPLAEVDPAEGRVGRREPAARQLADLVPCQDDIADDQAE